MTNSYDIAILGGGPGGYIAAIRASQLGMKTALIEAGNLGGTCTNIGCIPTKALIHSAHIYEGTKRYRSYGIPVKEVDFDWTGVNKYKERCVIKLRKGVELLMQQNKIDIINGFGQFRDTETIVVDGKSITAKNFIIATGSKTKSLPSLPIDGEKVITSDHALNLSELPKRILIVGAGAIGCEFAYVFNAFKVDVTVVEFLDNVLPFEDEDVSAELAAIFKQKKIKYHVRSSVEKLNVIDGAVIADVVPRDGGDTFQIETDMVLVAVGRAPSTENCGFEKIGLNLDKGFMVNDENLYTGVGNIYAIGDCAKGPMLAHKASTEGIIAVEKIAGLDRPGLNFDLVPKVTYFQPEVASVGMTEKSARERFGEIKISKVPFGSIGKAIIDGETSGFSKLIENPTDKKLIGASAIGPSASDLIATATTAITMGATVDEFAHVVQAHPTLNESWHETVHGLIGGPMVGV